MQISIIDFKNINLDDRMDAEYFEPSYLKIEERLKKLNAKPLSFYCKPTSSAFYPAATQLYEIGEVPFIRCVDSINYPMITTLQNETFERIPEFFLNKHKNIKVLENEDIVITKVGTPCYASIIKGIDRVALSRTVLGLYDIKDIDPYYLVVFLRSKYGFDQLTRERELTIQYQLTLERVGRILIYRPKNKNLEEKISLLLKKSQQLNFKAYNLFLQSQNKLLSHLGFDRFKSKKCLFFQEDFSKIQSIERMDAEYFQPKYEDILKIIRKYRYGWNNLNNLVNIKDKNYKPDKEKTYRYIELANIDPFGEITNAMIDKGSNLPSRARRKVITGDVIISSIEGSLNHIALITSEYDNALCSTGFYVINSEKINSETLFMLMKSIIGQIQLKRGCSGTILTAINKEEFSNIIIPKIALPIQEKIKEHISQVYSDRMKGRYLIEIAKKGVKLAIDKNEENATDWINKKIKNLNIKL